MKNRELKELTAQMAQGIDWQRPESRKQMFDVIMDATDEILGVEDFTTDILSAKTGKEFDTTKEEHVYLRDNVDDWAPGSYLDAATFGSKTYTFVAPEYKRLRVRIPIKMLERGDITTADAAEMMADAIIMNKLTRFFSILSAAVPGSQVVTSATPLSATAVQTGISYIEDFDSNDLVLIARKSLLRQLYESAGMDSTSGYSDATKAQLEKFGYIDRFAGVFLKPLASLIKPGTSTDIIPASTAYLVPRGCKYNQYIVYSEPDKDEWVDHETRTWNLSMVFNDDIKILDDINGKIHAVKLTTS